MRNERQDLPRQPHTPAPLVLAGGGALPLGIFKEILILARQGNNSAQTALDKMTQVRSSAHMPLPAPLKVAIATYASSHPQEAFEKILTGFQAACDGFFDDAQFHHLGLPVTEAHVENLDMFDVLFFSGGDQNKLLDATKNSLFEKKLTEQWSAGKLLIAGTSAGLQVCSPVAFTGEFNMPMDADASQTRVTSTGEVLGQEDVPYNTVYPGQACTRAGFHFLRNVILDQHFLKRQRFNRLFAASIDNPGFVGIGVDEETAIVLEPYWTKDFAEEKATSPNAHNHLCARVRVIGESGVFYCNGRRAQTRYQSASAVITAGEFSCGFVWNGGTLPFFIDYGAELDHTVNSAQH